MLVPDTMNLKPQPSLRFSGITALALQTFLKGKPDKRLEQISYKIHRFFSSLIDVLLY
ncbi:hypothetical protein GCM10023155_04900 [Bremerella cremea]